MSTEIGAPETMTYGNADTMDNHFNNHASPDECLGANRLRVSHLDGADPLGIFDQVHLGIPAIDLEVFWEAVANEYSVEAVTAAQ